MEVDRLFLRGGVAGKRAGNRCRKAAPTDAGTAERHRAGACAGRMWIV